MSDITDITGSEMIEATRLTREGRLAEATALLQHLLRRSKAAQNKAGYASCDTAGAPYVASSHLLTGDAMDRGGEREAAHPASPSVQARPQRPVCRPSWDSSSATALMAGQRHERMALLNLVYRDALFPLPAYRLAWQKLLADGDPRRACKSMVSLLALAHDRGCEAELAGALTEQMAGVGAAGIRVIDVAALQARFAPVSATMPDIAVNLPAVASYDVLLPSMGVAA